MLSWGFFSSTQAINNTLMQVMWKCGNHLKCPSLDFILKQYTHLFSDYLTFHSSNLLYSVDYFCCFIESLLQENPVMYTISLIVSV